MFNWWFNFQKFFDDRIRMFVIIFSYKNCAVIMFVIIWFTEDSNKILSFMLMFISRLTIFFINVSHWLKVNEKRDKFMIFLSILISNIAMRLCLLHCEFLSSENLITMMFSIKETVRKMFHMLQKKKYWIYFIKKLKIMKDKIHKMKTWLISSEFFSDIENLNMFVENVENTFAFFDSNL